MISQKKVDSPPSSYTEIPRFLHGTENEVFH